jgi:DNA mismatch endonuclease (patch repair protein)
MVDHLTPSLRSWNMGRISSKNTAPELHVRRALHKRGYRYRLHVSRLPGKPDIVLPSIRTAVFVHGCFWHRHAGCRQCTTPRSNVAYWIPKLEGNRKRDAEHRRALRKEKWRVVIIWACEANNPTKLERRLSRAGFILSDEALKRLKRHRSHREIVGSRFSGGRPERKRLLSN